MRQMKVLATLRSPTPPSPTPPALPPQLFADNPGGFLDEFSRDFEKGFMRILSHRHSTKRVKANSVYQEYIADKQHVHMNATTWGSLTAFLKYLER